jgi:hypothetical protein
MFGAVFLASAGSLIVLVARLIVFWRRLAWLGRMLRLGFVAVVVLLFVPSNPIGIRTLCHSMRALLPDARTVCLYGFRDRMRATADWEAIRQWSKDHHGERRPGDSAEVQLPPFIRSLDPWQVSVCRDGVVLKWDVRYASMNPPTCAALIVFDDEGRELKYREGAHRIAPGVWVAYYPAFDEE